VCQVKDGKGKSMGTGDFEVKERRMIFKNGTVGCSEIARQTEIQIGCNKEKARIKEVNERIRCSYEVTIGHPKCDDFLTPETACTVVLKKQLGRHPCKLGVSFGCVNSERIWVKSCKGTFNCNGKEKSCGAMVNQRAECSCK